MAEDPRMWTYWRDDKGLDAAIRDYFPGTVASEPRLQQAVAMRLAGELLINETMRELAERAEDRDPRPRT